MATTEVERLVVSLEASVTKFDRAMARATQQTNKAAKQIEDRWAKVGPAIGSGLTKAFAILGAGFSLQQAQRLLDASTRIQNALKVTGLAGEELTRVYESLYASAQRNAAPLEALTTLYGRAALVQNELGVSTEELLGFTDKVAVALRVSGQSAQEASGALLQLSQLLGSGVVRAEEFNSVQEGALPILQAVAAGLKEAGGSVAELRKLVIDGKVSSEAFFRAFEAGAPMLDEKVQNSQITVSQAFDRIQNSMINAVMEFDKSTGAANKFAASLDGVAAAIDGINVSGMIEQLAAGRSAMEQFFSNIGNSDVFKWLNSGTTPEQMRARGLIPMGAGSNAGDVIAGSFATIGAQRPNGPLVNALAAKAAGGRAIDQVSIADYAASGAAKTGKSSGQRFDDSLEAQRRRIDNLREENAIQATLNPLLNDYGRQLTELRTRQELLNAAEKAGVAVTPELANTIDQLAQGYADATVEAAKLAEAQDMARQQMEDWFSTSRDITRGFIDDLVAGKSAAEALGNVFQQLGSKLLDLGLNSLFGTGSGTNPFGLIGKALGFASGGYTGPGARNQPAGIVHKGEVVWSQGDVASAGGVAAVEAMRRGFAIPSFGTVAGAAGGDVNVTYAIDARGTDASVIGRLEGQLARHKAELIPTIRNEIMRRKKWGAKS